MKMDIREKMESVDKKATRPYRPFFPFFLLLIAAFSACAQEVSLSARLENPSTPFHRPGKLTLELQTPADSDVKLPGYTSENKDLEVTPGQPEAETTPEGRRILRQSYTLDPLKSGVFVVPSFQVSWGEGKKASTPPLVFRARDLNEAELVEVEKFDDIVLPSTLMREQQETPWGLIALVGGIVATAGLIAAWLLWKKGTPVPEAPPESAWDIAFRRLRDLKQRNLVELGNYDQFYVDLSSILRFYIEDQFHLHAPEQTTQEFLEAMAKSGSFRDDHQRLLAHFLRHADRVKFARLEPSREDMLENLGAVHRFVQETVPRLAPEEAAA